MGDRYPTHGGSQAGGGAQSEQSHSPPPPPAESVGQPEEVSPEGQPEEAGAEEASAGAERPEEEAVAYLDELPEPLLLRVLAELPAAQLVQACRLVCLRWKELVDGAPLWLLKCQQEGLVPEGGAEDERDHWQQFYFLSKRRRNLLRNPCGEGERLGGLNVPFCKMGRNNASPPGGRSEPKPWRGPNKYYTYGCLPGRLFSGGPFPRSFHPPRAGARPALWRSLPGGRENLGTGRKCLPFCPHHHLPSPHRSSPAFPCPRPPPPTIGARAGPATPLARSG